MKNIIYLLLLFCIMTSCSTYHSMIRADANMKNINLGMTKEQVISVMGKSYEIISSRDSMLTLGYKSGDYGIYRLLFIDGKLKEWDKEWLTDRYVKESSYKYGESK